MSGIVKPVFTFLLTSPLRLQSCSVISTSSSLAFSQWCNYPLTHSTPVFLWCDVMWCDVMWSDVMWCDMTSMTCSNLLLFLVVSIWLRFLHPPPFLCSITFIQNDMGGIKFIIYSQALSNIWILRQKDLIDNFLRRDRSPLSRAGPQVHRHQSSLSLLVFLDQKTDFPVFWLDRSLPGWMR